MNVLFNNYVLHNSGPLGQTVRHPPLTAGIPISRHDHSCVSCGRNGVWVGFSRVLSRFLLPQISFHHFPTFISFISFHFIRPCDGASNVVGRNPSYSRTYHIGASSHLIPRPDFVLTRVEDILLIYLTIKIIH